MEYIKVSEEEVYEVLEKHMLESAAAYNCKVHRYTHNRKEHERNKFENYTFVLIPIKYFNEEYKISQKEFLTLLEINYHKTQLEVKKRELTAEGPFALTPFQTTSRSSYWKSHKNKYKILS